MIEITVGVGVIALASTSLVTIAAAFARTEVRQREVFRQLSNKAQKDVVEVQLEAVNDKLDLIITQVQLIQRR